MFFSQLIIKIGIFSSLFFIINNNNFVIGVKNVTIAKCCMFEESLNTINKCDGHSTNFNWNIKVYSPAKRTYLQNLIPTNWHLKESVRPQCDQPALFTSNLGNYIAFQNGSLFIVEYNKLIHPNYYCIDYSSALVCLDDDNNNNSDSNKNNNNNDNTNTNNKNKKNYNGQNFLSMVHIKKCCGKDAIFSDTNQTCIFIKNNSYKINLDKNKTLTSGFPQCIQHKVAFVGKLDEARLQPNGSLWLDGIKTLLPVANYCLEHVLENTGRFPSIMICQEFLPSSIQIDTETNSDIRFTLYPIGLALSAVFLAATLAAGSVLPASHHVLHWRCQTNHVACLLVGDILLCITHLSGRMASAPCFIIAVSMHFLFLAAFFWLNTMCFNIWWTFRDLRPQNIEKGQERCRLRLYEIYAWGGPLIIATTAAILDTIPDNPNYTFLKPKFGASRCWFHGDMEILTFFFGPVGVLLLINLCLFAITARELTCGLWKRELVKSNTESSNSKISRAALGRVCLKLVVVMGVTWIADVLSWIIGGPQELWYLTDLINCLQGVFIFIVVGCQPQVLSAIKRIWCLKKYRNNGTAGTTNHHSSSSQGLPSMGDTITNNSLTNNTTKTIPLETSC